MKPINLTVNQLWDQDCEIPSNQHYCIYTLFNQDNECVYVGKTVQAVHKRWFSGSNSHIFNTTRGWRGNTMMGQYVCRELPRSLSWMMTIYSASWILGTDDDEPSIIDAENEMIRRLNPRLNRSRFSDFNPFPDPEGDAMIIKAMRDDSEPDAGNVLWGHPSDQVVIDMMRKDDHPNKPSDWAFELPILNP